MFALNYSYAYLMAYNSMKDEKKSSAENLLVWKNAITLAVCVGMSRRIVLVFFF